MFSKEETIVLRLGNCSIPSPLRLSKQLGDGIFDYVQDEERILYDLSLQNYINSIGQALEPVSFEKSGPKEYIYFDPSKTKAAIVTCGGLCPGLNNVIRGLVMQLSKRYGVNRIVGIKYGYEGFIPKYQHEVIDLDTEKVEDIHMQGGSILGTSRGHQEPSEIVDALEKMNINLLFTIGGDGTLHGTQAITDEITKEVLKLQLLVFPKLLITILI